MQCDLITMIKGSQSEELQHKDLKNGSNKRQATLCK